MDILGQLLNQPIVQGIVLKQIMDALQVFLKNVDDQGLAKQAAGWLQPALVGLTMLTTAVSLALQGQLHTLDLSQLQVYVLALVQTYLGAKAAGTLTAQTVAAKVISK